MVQGGPKGSEKVNLDVFDNLGPFWAHLDTFGLFLTKVLYKLCSCWSVLRLAISIAIDVQQIGQKDCCSVVQPEPFVQLAHVVDFLPV